MTAIPHLRIIVCTCLVAVAGYAIFSGWAVFYSDDAALRGDVIGTWKSFAVAAFTFWIGSSSGGKTRAEPEPAAPAPQSAAAGAQQAADAAQDEAAAIAGDRT
jgi:hypothetical protein